MHCIFKEIEDPSKSDGFIIEKLKALIINEDAKKLLKDATEGADDFSMLHMAAKYCRIVLCSALIQEFKFGSYVKYKTKYLNIYI